MWKAEFVPSAVQNICTHKTSTHLAQIAVDEHIVALEVSMDDGLIEECVKVIEGRQDLARPVSDDA